MSKAASAIFGNASGFYHEAMVKERSPTPGASVVLPPTTKYLTPALCLELGESNLLAYRFA